MLQTGLPNRAKPKIILFFLQNQFVLKTVWQTILRFSTDLAVKTVLSKTVEPVPLCKTISCIPWGRRSPRTSRRPQVVPQARGVLARVTPSRPSHQTVSSVGCPHWDPVEILVHSLTTSPLTMTRAPSPCVLSLTSSMYSTAMAPPPPSNTVLEPM